MQCKENSCIFTNFCYKLKHIFLLKGKIEIMRQWMESSQNNVEPVVDSGNPLTFGINPLGYHRRCYVSDDSGYEGGDNEKDQNNGSPIKVKLEDQDQLLNVIIGPSSPNQPSELSDSSEELVPIPSVTPLMPEVNPDSKRQTRTWIYRGKICQHFDCL